MKIRVSFHTQVDTPRGLCLSVKCDFVEFFGDHAVLVERHLKTLTRVVAKVPCSIIDKIEAVGGCK